MRRDIPEIRIAVAHAKERGLRDGLDHVAYNGTVFLTGLTAFGLMFLVPATTAIATILDLLT